MVSSKAKTESPVCMITGGSSGIGLATARKFAESGYRIAICGRTVEAPQNAANEILAIQEQSAKAVQDEPGLSPNCLASPVDLNDIDQAKQFANQVIRSFGRVDVLVNNAAVVPLAPFDAITPEDFENTINVNLRSLFYLTQIVWKQMRGQGSSKYQSPSTIVNISSLAAVDPFPGFSIYGASKAWLDLLTHSLAKEGEAYNIRVFSIRPGAVETPLLRRLFPDYPADQCVSPEQIAESVFEYVTSSKKS